MMGVEENKVETRLKHAIQAQAGIARKWTSPGRDGVPDQIIRLPGWPAGQVLLVEVKTTAGRLSVRQQREHATLREVGLKVVTIYGSPGLAMLLDDLARVDGISMLQDVYK